MKTLWMIIMAVVLLFTNGSAETAYLLPEFKEYINSPAEHQEVLQNVIIEEFCNEIVLDKDIFSVAVGKEGIIAIESNSSQANYYTIITVYSSEGEYLFGYSIRINNPKGLARAFFSNDGYLCFQIGYVAKKPNVGVIDQLLVLDPNGGGCIESYCVPYEATDRFIRQIKRQGITIQYAYNCPFLICDVDDAYLSLKDTETGRIVEIYDYREANETYKRNKNMRAKESLPIVGVTFLIIIGTKIGLSKIAKHNE